MLRYYPEAEPNAAARAQNKSICALITWISGIFLRRLFACPVGGVVGNESIGFYQVG